MKRKTLRLALLLLALAALLSTAAFAAATDSADAAESATSGKAIACGIAIGFAAGGGAIGMGLLCGRACDGIARQPEVSGQIRSNMMLSLVFVETAIIYALLVVILIIFVL